MPVTRRLAPVLFAALLITLAACGAAAQPDTTPDPAAEGRRLFTIWCSGCHAVAADAPAGIGPSLAGVAGRAAANPEGLSAADWLRRETVDPNAVITPGSSAGLMPANYEQSLRPEQIDALVAYMLTLE
jgi:mono/diheme cytochrome c family protein